METVAEVKAERDRLRIELEDAAREIQHLHSRIFELETLDEAKLQHELVENLIDMTRRFEGCLMMNGADREFAKSSTVHAWAAIAKVKS